MVELEARPDGTGRASFTAQLDHTDPLPDS